MKIRAIFQKLGKETIFAFCRGGYSLFTGNREYYSLPTLTKPERIIGAALFACCVGWLVYCIIF